jgi:hypothetical protein
MWASSVRVVRSYEIQSVYMLARAGADTTILGGDDADCAAMTAEGCARRFGFVPVADAIVKGLQEYQAAAQVTA